MFIEMIDRHMFQEFIRNSTATVLEGNFVTGSARTHYYRIVRVPLAIGEHYIEALYGHQCYSGPNSWESQCKNLVEATSKCKNVRITIEANGKQMEVSYPVAGIASRQMVCDKTLSIWHIAPQKLGDTVEEFLKENYPNGHKYRYDIPMKLVSRVESGRKALWVNPFFEEV